MPFRPLLGTSCVFQSQTLKTVITTALGSCGCPGAGMHSSLEHTSMSSLSFRLPSVLCLGCVLGSCQRKPPKPKWWCAGTCLKAAYEVVLVFSEFLFLSSVLHALPAGIAWSQEIGFTTSMAVYFVNMIDPQLSSMAI